MSSNLDKDGIERINDYQVRRPPSPKMTPDDYEQAIKAAQNQWASIQKNKSPYKSLPMLYRTPRQHPNVVHGFEPVTVTGKPVNDAEGSDLYTETGNPLPPKSMLNNSYQLNWKMDESDETAVVNGYYLRFWSASDELYTQFYSKLLSKLGNAVYDSKTDTVLYCRCIKTIANYHTADPPNIDAFMKRGCVYRFKVGSNGQQLFEAECVDNSSGEPSSTGGQHTRGTQYVVLRNMKLLYEDTSIDAIHHQPPIN